MRIVIALSTAAAALLAVSALADDLPEGVGQTLTCGHVYSLRSEELRQAGDDGGATELSYMSDALLQQARVLLEGSGYTAAEIDDIDMSHALTTGFNYGAGMGEQMLADCLAAWDSP
ncbi:MAG TPA: hypothetical protein GYA10_03535 [Alphaproteobacteria bacterium]|nr:hypothetical protein [Alphaproteobacteria bacterium]